LTLINVGIRRDLDKSQMTEDMRRDAEHCPNCGQPLAFTMTIRRAFDEDADVFQCRPCGVSLTKPAKQSRPRPTK
jgi:hypothetical protein